MDSSESRPKSTGQDSELIGAQAALIRVADRYVRQSDHPAAIPISAHQIGEWASGYTARAELPSLIRRLIHATADIEQISFPAGKSVDLPGFDGAVGRQARMPLGA